MCARELMPKSGSCSRAPRKGRGSGRRRSGVLLVLLAILTGFDLRSPARTEDNREVGVASYYAHKFHGRRTASGEIFDMNKLTAAHPKLAFGTKVKVTRMDDRRSVIVKINDRGPFVRGRVIDLSLAAARELDMVESGIVRVSIVALE